MSNNNNSSDATASPGGGRMYHYLYGSIQEESSSANNNKDTTSSRPTSSAASSPAASPSNHNNNSLNHSGIHETDSLVGECLVSTDNEDEDSSPNKSHHRDFQHLLMSSGDGNERIINIIDNNKGRDPRSGNDARFCCWSWSSANDHEKDGENNGNHGGFMMMLLQKLPNLAVMFVIFMVVLLATMILYPQSWLATTMDSSSWKFTMKFPRVHRADYGDPVESFMDPTLFHPSLLMSMKKKSRRMTSSANEAATAAAAAKLHSDARHTFIFPFPTGAFWTNLALPSTADRGISYPIAVYPYAYKWGSGGILQASYPARHRREELKAIHLDFMPDLTFSNVIGSGNNGNIERGDDDNTQTRREIVAFDPLSVTVRFSSEDDNNSFWESYLVQGSPYITIKYRNTTPKIRSFSVFSSIFCPRDDDMVMNYGAATDTSSGTDVNTSSSTTTASGDNSNGNGKRDNSGRRLKFGVCYTEDVSPQGNANGKTILYRGVQFILQTQEGMNWMVFASEPITFVYDQYHRTTIEATTAYNGVLRFAYVPPSLSKPTNGTIDVFSSTGLQRLIYHAGVYPKGGDVSWSFRTGAPESSMKMATAKTLAKIAAPSNQGASPLPNRIGTLQFDFDTETFAPASSASTPKALLMLALPHHAQSLPSGVQLSSKMFDLSFNCIKGPLRPILGSSWSYDEELPSLGIDGDSGSNGNRTYLEPSVRAVLVKNLDADVKLVLPQLDENVYGFGKQVARLAQLAHIADTLIVPETTSPRGSNSSTSKDEPDIYNERLRSVLDDTIHQLSSYLKKFLTNEVTDYLVYDDNLGGLVTVDGLRDSHADFGNGRYNDHLFHYGYILYACAILARLKPAFVDNYGEYVDAIYYDVAYDSNSGSHRSEGAFFPLARHKVWFDGHSFASGLFPFGNGKSQESSSEAVNCYYGAYLWSLARHSAASNPDADASAQSDFARLLLATEIRGARTYWHMTPSKETNGTESLSVYSPSFAKNYMVGNVGMLDAICSTWFGTDEVYVHMINFLPITSATGELFGRDFAQKEYNSVLKPLREVQMAWRGYVIGDKAISDPLGAWNEAQLLPSGQLDSGLSKTQLLFWISNRKGFVAPDAAVDASPVSQTANVSSPSENANENDDDTEASCLKHKICVAQMLGGNCCPTDQGVRLDCCSR